MTFLQSCWTWLVAIVFIAALVPLVWRIILARRRKPELPAEVCEPSHELSTETARLREGLHKITNGSRDPLADLVRSVRRDIPGPF